jgi:hypothetical protein
MGNLLGKEKPLKEVLRENKRMITRAIRELDREKAQLEKEEKRLTIEIKKAAKEQQMSSVKIMAKVSDGIFWSGDIVVKMHLFVHCPLCCPKSTGPGSDETVHYEIH